MLEFHAQSIDARIREVYAGKTEEMAAADPEWLKLVTDFVENRVKVTKITLDPDHDKYPKLSEVALHNEYNPHLQRDMVFDPVLFNPLKYDFIFSAKTTQVYRVDHTDYVIVIEPQSFK